MIGAGSALRSQPEPTAEENLLQAREGVAGMRAEIARLEALLADDPGDASSWEGLILQRSFLVSFEHALANMEAGVESPPPSLEEIRRRQEGWIAEWIAAVPGDAKPHLYRARTLFAEQPEARSEALREVAARFADDFAAQSAWANDLVYRGAGAEAVEEMTAYLDRHPTSEAFAWVASYYDRNDAAKADEIVDRWIERHPDDPNALEYWYGRQARKLENGESRALAADIAARVPPENAVSWCLRLWDSQARTGLEAASACFERALAALDRSDGSYDSLRLSYATMVGRAGDYARFAEVARGLPDELRWSAAKSSAESLFYDGQCDQGVALLEVLEVPAAEAVSLPTVVGREPPCVRFESFRGLVAAAVATAEPFHVVEFVRKYSPHMPAEPLETALRRRLAATPDRQLFESLDDLTLIAGRPTGGKAASADPARRIAVLEQWLQADPGNATAASRLSAALDWAGNPERAVQVLEAAAALDANRDNYALQQQLAGQYAQAGRFDEAEAVAQRMLASEEQAYQGHLLLAEVALAREDLTRALGHYERFFDAASPHEWKRADTYKYVLAELDDGERLVSFLEGLWEKSLAKGVRPQGTREEWIATQLGEAGAIEEALAYYERRLAAGPLPPDSLRQVAGLAEVAERWDTAERIRVALRDAAPNEVESWAQLAEYYLRRDQVDRAFDVLEQAQDRIDGAAPALSLLWAEALVGGASTPESVPTEDLVEAIRVLENAKASFDGGKYGWVTLDQKLAELYTLLGTRELQPAPEAAP